MAPTIVGGNTCVVLASESKPLCAVSFAEVLHALPVGGSQRISTRYLYIFALLLSAAAVWSLARALERKRRRWHLAVVALSGFITVAAFLGAYVKMLPEVGLASNMRDHRADWRSVDRGAPVTRVTFFTDFDGATGRTCYEPILNSAGTPSLVLHEGSPLDIENGHYNLMNPACYQYPDQNDCKPGERISVDDGDNLRRLTNGLPVTWRISTAQHLADGLTLLSLLTFVAFFIVGRRVRAKYRSRTL